MTGIRSLFASFSSNDSVLAGCSLDSVREAMLDAMGASGASGYPLVRLRLSYANEIQDLWYLREDLMSVIAAIEGESVARSKLTQISQMFRGLMPRGMSTRPSRLGN